MAKLEPQADVAPSKTFADRIPLFRLTPRGDAVRGWGVLIPAFAVYGLVLALTGAEGGDFCSACLPP